MRKEDPKAHENPPSLEKVNADLEALKKTQASATKRGVAPKGEAAKAAIDFASASAVGIVLGYGVDQWLDSAPIGLIVGMLLGFAAGVKMMMHGFARKKKD